MKDVIVLVIYIGVCLVWGLPWYVVLAGVVGWVISITLLNRE